MKLQDHDAVRDSWSLLFGGPGSEDRVIKEVKLIKQQPIDEDYLEVLPEVDCAGSKVLLCKAPDLILNLKKTLKESTGLSKRKVGDLEVHEDLTLVSAPL